MTEILETVIKATLTFTATNIDDIFILMLFYSRAAVYPRVSIVAGQYLGFTALVLISLLGFLAGLFIPQMYIGLLGFVPIVIGVRAWLNRNDEPDENEIEDGGRSRTLFASILSVAAVTFANGGDNIGIYTPLFASSDLPALIIILVIFYLLLGVWCAAGYFLTRQPLIAKALAHYGHYIVPFVLVALGIYILIESGSYNLISGP